MGIKGGGGEVAEGLYRALLRSARPWSPLVLSRVLPHRGVPYHPVWELREDKGGHGR